MDARIVRFFVLFGAGWSLGASARTEHFIVTAPNAQIAQQVASAAENYRRDLAIEWLGKELPQWADVCPIRVLLNRPACGETSFEFPLGGGHPRNWRMTVEGPLDLIMDSVLPHEILHTIFATHFQNPLPRWADEGACTTVEGPVERGKHDQMLIRFLKGEDGIPFNKMFRMREYPRKILPLYSQGYSVASYLIAQGGKQKFVNFVGHGMQTDNWTDATKRYYGYTSLSDLQVKWVAWVGNGSPPLRTRQPEALASADADPTLPNPNGRLADAGNMQTGVQTSGVQFTSAPQAQQQSPAQPSQTPPQPENPSSRAVNSGQPPRPFTAPPQGTRPLQVLKDSGWYVRQAKQGASGSQIRQPMKAPTSASPAPTPSAAPNAFGFGSGLKTGIAPRRVSNSKANSNAPPTPALPIEWSRASTSHVLR